MGNVEAVVGFCNCASREVNKSHRFGRRPTSSREVSAAGIGQCHVILDCRLHEARINCDYPLFVWRVLRLRGAGWPALPGTAHYRGGGRFVVSGREVSRRRLFRPDMLDG